MDHSKHDTSVSSPEELTARPPLDADSDAPYSQEKPVTSKATNEQNIQLTLQSLADRALAFLSTASNEILGACLVGLGAATYLILGRVGLVLIGVVGGVILHATWDGRIRGAQDGEAHAAEEKRRKEVGLDVAQRVLKWRLQEKERGDKTDSDLDVSTLEGQELDFSDFRPETQAALTELTDAVIRDYVKWWYSPILPKDTVFPATCRKTFVKFLLSISNHLSRKRPADVFLDFLTNSSSIVIVFLNELATAMNASPTSAAADAIQTYSNLKPDSSLANVLDMQNQERKLDMVAEDILKHYLDAKVYTCDPTRIFLREVLAKLVLEYTVTLCSKPDWINEWIVYLLEEGQPEISQVIDAGVESQTGNALEVAKQKSLQKAADAKDVRDGVSREGDADHERTVSRAQEAMEDAMLEAQRLTQLMAEEDERRKREEQSAATSWSAEPYSETTFVVDPQPPAEEKPIATALAASTSTSHLSEDTSDSHTQGVATPSSSQSDAFVESERSSDRGISSESMRTDTTQPSAQAQFTSFDQLGLPAAPPQDDDDRQQPAPLTLHNATISIMDDSMPGDRSAIKSKPMADYMIQIEPSNPQYHGWMIFRKYADFETLHEVLKRIAKITNAAGFAQAHDSIPGWKGRTKAHLRDDLERYLMDAVRFQSLAESEGMKRFLEKDQGLNKSPSANKGFGWPTPTAFENAGKGMMDVLTQAPKGIAGGGKSILGGVSGVLGGIGPKRSSMQTNPANLSRAATANPSHVRTDSSITQLPKARQSEDSLRKMSVVDQQPSPISQMERRPSYNPDVEAEIAKPRPSVSSRTPPQGRSSVSSSRQASRRPSMEISLAGDQIVQLPPPPSEVDDDYGDSTTSPVRPSVLQQDHMNPLARTSMSKSRLSLDSTQRPTSPIKPPSNLNQSITSLSFEQASAPHKPTLQVEPKKPLTEQETTVTIELLFAAIQSLYTLSSAWGLRRTLLAAAKTFLLRPGNPQLSSITTLVQTAVLDSNTSDGGIALHLRKMRLNALPTEEELKLWPPPLVQGESENLRRKARKLLVEKGMPAALVGVMGVQATGEALGRVFDALQVDRVARGLIFGLVLQGVRVIVT